MNARIVFMIVFALWGWDVATPVQPLAHTIVWDEEEEVARPRASQVARPSLNDGDVVPARPAPRVAIRRFLAGIAAHSRSSQPGPLFAPRARLRAALADSPSEDH